MINQVLLELKENLLGKAPRRSLLEKIARTPDEESLYPVLGVQEDAVVWYYGLIVHLLHLMYHEKLEQVDAERRRHQVPKVDFVRIAELAVDFLYGQERYENCLSLVDYCPMDPGRVTMIFIHYFRGALDRMEFDRAHSLWNKFRDKGVSEQIVHDEVKRVFKRVADFRAQQERRNYKPMFKLVELFNVSKAITHWVGMEQYKFNMEIRDYYTAAQIAKRLNLNRKFSNRAGFEAFRYAMNRFKEKVSMGRYNTPGALLSSDPLNIAKHVIDEFHLLDYKGKEENRDARLIKSVNETAYDAFVHVISVGVLSGNAPAMAHSFAVRLLKDFDLLNERLNPLIAGAAKEKLEKLIAEVESATSGDVDAAEYYDLLKTIRMMYTESYTRFDAAALNIVRNAFTVKNSALAGAISKDFTCPLAETTALALENIHAWMAAEDFDSIMAALQHFPVHQALKLNPVFMKSLRKYYLDTIAEQKYLKAITIAQAFHLDRSYVMNAIHVTVLRELENGNIGEIKALFRKYRIHRNEYLPLMQETYLVLLENKRDLAVKLHSEFGLSIFDIGLFNWILREVLGLKTGRNLEQKIHQEVEKINREITEI